MNTLYGLIERLIQLSIENKLITSRDAIYMRNRLLDAFCETDYEQTAPCETDLYETLDQLAHIAIQKELIEDTLAQRDIFTSSLMNLFLPVPSLVENHFWSLYQDTPQKATEYFYNLSRMSNYVKVNRIAKNILFKTPSAYGPLDITINLSKPEKDPKDIAKQKNMKSTNYPTCLLCIENEGYAGTSTHPDRANHRTIDLHLNHRDWRLQYSPYLYYNEHCILLSSKHEPMSLTENSFYNLLSFVEQFPHYFIGSNADLPIVGGSILAHEHYQGGCYEFPMHSARVMDTFTLDKYPNITCQLLNWPLSTISISGQNLDEVAKCTNYIYEKWKTYSDPEVNILASTEDVRHNTITPVARKQGNAFVMDIVLRNNRTSEEHPLGIFHPHSDVQHIKKENIGLIEVMGLAVLPARLKDELEEVKAFILDQPNAIEDYHLEWAKELKVHYNSTIDINTYIHNAVGQKFTRVLEDAGVFKMTSEGISHFKQFINSL
ncbi:MAG: UDP-glucose--hexose-1-phosphate uridylyltransferase [Cellulosilyticum sp.]|nr:UDP-glucose--hexose-1-phosphate uridylyltransferase [Cellulosilyticum sp.]